MRVAIVSDVVCPWCRIGKANLMQAAAEWTRETGDPVGVALLPFLLDPVEPGVKEDFRERFTKRKGIPQAQMEATFDRVTQVGAQQGLRFNFDRVKVAVDTVPAHELMELTRPEKQFGLMDAMMTAYFEEGRDIGEIDVLLSIAKDAGLTDEELKEIEPALRSRKMEGQVRSTIAQMQDAGIHGVPYFIINNAVVLSGAQPVEVFLQAFEQAKDAQPAGAR